MVYKQRVKFLMNGKRVSGMDTDHEVSEYFVIGEDNFKQLTFQKSGNRFAFPVCSVSGFTSIFHQGVDKVYLIFWK